MSEGDVIGLIFDWMGRVDFIKILIPVVVVLIALAVFSWKVKKYVEDAVGENLTKRLTDLHSDFDNKITESTRKLADQLHQKFSDEAKTAINGALGAFKPEIEKIITSAIDAKAVTEKLEHAARAAVEASAEEQRQKMAAAAERARLLAEKADLAAGSGDAELQEQYEMNWGELQALWRDVWQWTRGQLNFAIGNHNSNRVRGLLKELSKHSPTDVISALWKYGYYGDREADLALEMAEMFNRHKTKRVRVDEGTLREFKRKYKEWQQIDQ